MRFLASIKKIWNLWVSKSSPELSVGLKFRFTTLRRRMNTYLEFGDPLGYASIPLTIREETVQQLEA